MAQSQQAQFDAILARNRGRFAAIAHAYAGHESDDLLQEILLQVWRGLKRFEGKSSVDTWCYRVALNTALSWRRTLGRKKKHLPAEAADVGNIKGSVDAHDELALLQQFLATLSDAERAIVLMYLDDLNGKEIAEVTGLSEGAVRVRIHRVKQKLAAWSADE